MYFGGFGMKTAPAMGKQNYSISTTLTGDSGEAFLAALNDTQRKYITDIIDLQRKDLAEIVTTRRAIATELRKFQSGNVGRQGQGDVVVETLWRTGRRDVLLLRHRLRPSRQESHDAAEGGAGGMRTTDPNDPKGPFLYSTPINSPNIPNTDFLFQTPKP